MAEETNQPGNGIMQMKAPRSWPIRRHWFLWLLALLLLGIGVRYLGFELRSYALLTHFVDPQASGPLLRWETRDVTAQEVQIPAAGAVIPARIYKPVGISHPSGMVIAHGIHHLGINEPRLMNFARAMAGMGIEVVTPELAALADYHVDAGSIARIGDSAAWLEQQLGRGPVMVTGISFAGGLALLAACDAKYAPHIKALALMGAHDDLARVSRFLVTNQMELPDGRTIPFTAHPYGAQVFVYAHLDQFFPPADLPAAHQALRYLLWEEPQDAQPWLAKLSPEARATMDVLFARQFEPLRPKILEAIREDEQELDALSPHGHIASLRVPVFILHGAADDVIPSSESLWLEREVPPSALRAVLITPVFSHVDAKKSGSWIEELRLVHFISSVLRAAE